MKMNDLLKGHKLTVISAAIIISAMAFSLASVLASIIDQSRILLLT